LNEANRNITTAISSELNLVLSKKQGWKQLQHINNILCGISSNIDYHEFDLNDTACMNIIYLPITLVDITYKAGITN
jgi:hypothetical protein